MIKIYQPIYLSAVLELLRKNTPEYFDISEEKDFEDYLENKRELYYIYEINDKIVGCGGINFWENGTVARIAWDIVNPKVQGQGIGKALTLFRINEIKKYPDVRQIVVRTSQKAFRFYEKFGFQLQYIEKDYWAVGLDLYEMHINLN